MSRDSETDFRRDARNLRGIARELSGWATARNQDDLGAIDFCPIHVPGIFNEVEVQHQWRRYQIILDEAIYQPPVAALTEI
jgi:hypothetical protein